MHETPSAAGFMVNAGAAEQCAKCWKAIVDNHY